MARPKSPTGLARRPWYAWLELQYRSADEVIANTLVESSTELEEVPSELREQRDAKLYEIVKFFYNQVESLSGKDIRDEPLFARSAERNWDLARILGCIGGSYYGEQEISKTRWNKDLAAVKVAIARARNWFLRHDRESETADAKTGKAVRAGAKAGGKSRSIPMELKMQEARRYQAELEKLMRDDKWLRRTEATVQVGRKNGRSGKHVQRYLKLLTKK